MTESTTQTSERFSSRLRHHPLAAFRAEIDDLLSRFLGGVDEAWFAGRMVPLADLSETETSVHVSVDLPGVDPDEIEIHLAGVTLNIRGERKAEETEKGRTFHRVERRRGSFSRSITLPCPVAEDEGAAEYRDGVLSITLPKSEEAQSRKIEVRRS